MYVKYILRIKINFESNLHLTIKHTLMRTRARIHTFRRAVIY